MAKKSRHQAPFIDFKADTQTWWQKARLAAGAIYSREARRRLHALLGEFRPEVAHVRNIYHHLSPSILWELKAQRVPVLYHLNDFKLLCPSYNMVSQGNPCERCADGAFRHVISEGCYRGPHRARWVMAAEAYLHSWLRTYEKCVNLFLAPSLFVKDKLVEHGWDAERIAVLPHFQRLAVETLQPAEDAPILYFGRLSPEKGVEDLLRAMQGLPGVRLQIAGDGPQRKELEAIAAEHNRGNVEFLGQLSGRDLREAIAAARFTVFPSRAYETLGKSILESYAHGRAVVASDLGSRRELVREAETGLLYQAGNVVWLREALGYLVKHPEAAARMGAAGRDWVRRKHSPDAYFGELMELYEGLRRRSSGLRVAFIGGRGVAGQYSGIETYYEEAGKRLAARGHSVTVYCRSYFTPKCERFLGMRVLRMPTIRTKHLETVIHTLLSTVHAAMGDYDIVHFHALGPALFSFIPRLLGKRAVVTVQGLDGRRRKWNAVAAALLRAGEHAAVRWPDSTMVVSRTLQQHYAAKGAKTVYVPNGTILREARLPSGVGKWGLEAKRYILFLGRLSPEKNCHLLLQAFLRCNSDVHLVMAGDGSGEYARGLQIYAGERIHFVGRVNGAERDELLCNAMLLVLPSDIEGLALVLLEAMGAGVCTLASDIPENRELVEGAGFTFRRGDVEDLARMLDLLVEHPELRREAERKARVRIREQYLWGQVVDEIEGVYREVCGAQTEIEPARTFRAAA